MDFACPGCDSALAPADVLQLYLGRNRYGSAATGNLFGDAGKMQSLGGPAYLLHDARVALFETTHPKRDRPAAAFAHGNDPRRHIRLSDWPQGGPRRGW